MAVGNHTKAFTVGACKLNYPKASNMFSVPVGRLPKVLVLLPLHYPLPIYFN